MSLVRNQTAAFAKPTVGSTPNKTHSLTKGLIGAWLFNEGSGTRVQDVIGGVQGSLATQALNTATWGKTPYGPTVRITNANQYVSLGAANRIFRVQANQSIREFSIVHCYSRLEMTNEAGWSFGVRTTQANAASSLQANIPDATGNILWQVGGTNTSINQLTLSGAAPSFDIWVFTNSRARGMEIWQNGILKSFDRAKNPVWTSTSANLVLGDPYTETTAPNLGAEMGDHYLFYVYNRAITPEEVTEVSHRPFSMFKPTYLILPSTPAVFVGQGGLHAGGVANISTDIIASGGVRAGGKAKNAYFNQALNASGGIEGNGTAGVLRILVPEVTGAILAGGTATVNVVLKTSGGLLAGGQATVAFNDVVDASSNGVRAGGTANVQFVNSQSSATGGLSAGGTAVLGSIYITQGGARIGGSAIKEPGTTTVTASGGAYVGGNGKVASFVHVPIQSFAAVAGGRAIAILRGTIQNVHVGYALAMAGNNIVKTTVALQNAKPKIIDPFKDQSTELPESGYKFEETSEWCFIEDCTDNVLCRTTVNQQGVYLPPQKPAKLTAL